MTHSTSIENLDELPLLIEHDDELWRNTWELYLTVAQNPKTNDTQRQAVLQLAQDAKEQYAIFIKRAEIQQNKVSNSKWRNKISTIACNRKFKSICIVLSCFFIIILVLMLYRLSSHDMRISLTSTTTRRTRTAASTSIGTKSTSHDQIGRTDATWPNTKTTIGTTIATQFERTSVNRVKPIVIWVVLICLLLFTFCCIVSYSVRFRQIIIFLRDILWHVISTRSKQTDVSLIDRNENILLLDPMEQYSNLYTLVEDNLSVYTSTNDCFEKLALNHHEDYVLFLPITIFEAHSFELVKLPNVSLCIFYNDNDQSRLQISKIKYHIRFIFPETRLLEHLRHTIILNCAKQGYLFRLQGLEYEADEKYLVASRQSRMLADELGQQSSTASGTETQESLPHTTENVNDLIYDT